MILVLGADQRLIFSNQWPTMLWHVWSDEDYGAWLVMACYVNGELWVEQVRAVTCARARLLRSLVWLVAQVEQWSCYWHHPPASPALLQCCTVQTNILQSLFNTDTGHSTLHTAAETLTADICSTDQCTPVLLLIIDQWCDQWPVISFSSAHTWDTSDHQWRLVSTADHQHRSQPLIIRGKKS